MESKEIDYAAAWKELEDNARLLQNRPDLCIVTLSDLHRLKEKHTKRTKFVPTARTADELDIQAMQNSIC